MYILADVVPDFVKILGYGLSGFAFLLMFFAYMLLRQVITKQTQNKMIFKSIWGFMGLSFVLTIIIGIFSYMTGDYKKQELVKNEETITKQQNGIDALTDGQALDSLIKNVAVTDSAKTDTKKVDETIKKYETTVASLQTKLNKANATAEEKKKVSELKEENTRALDSLKRPLPPDVRLRLNNRILSQTNEISRITTEAVRRDMKRPAGALKSQTN